MRPTIIVWILVMLLGWGAPPSVEAQSITARNKFKVGRTCFEKGEYARAIELFEQALKDEPHYPDAHYLIGLSYLGMKNYDKAREKLQYVIQIEPQFFEAYQNLGNVYMAQKKYKEAKEHFNRMKTVPKAAPVATYCLGVVAYIQEDLKEAEKQFQEALRLDPKMARARNNLGVLHQADNRPKEALNDFAAASRIDPTNPSYLVQQAFMQFALDNKTGAKASLEKAKRLSDKRQDIGFLAEALNQFIDGNPDKSIRACNLALERNPDLTSAILLKARCLEQQKKPDEARQAYQAAVESDPNVKEAKQALERLKPPESPTPSPSPSPAVSPSASPSPKPSPAPKPRAPSPTPKP